MLSGTDLLVFVAGCILAVAIGFGILFARNDTSLMSDEQFDDYIDELDEEDESEEDLDDQSDSV